MGRWRRRGSISRFLFVASVSLTAAGQGFAADGGRGETRQTRPDARLDARAEVRDRRAQAPRPSVEPFVVRPFVNTSKVRSFDYLEAGLPAIIADRLAHHGPLRFVGGPALLSKGASPVARWSVDGEFARRPDWKVEITVRVRELGGANAMTVQAVRIGSKDAVARLGVEAALEAFAAAPGLKLPPPTEALTAPFGRDPYAFVLYGRGVATNVGIGKPRSAERATDLLKRSLVIDPKVPETRRYLGFLHLEAGRPGHARVMWTYALDVRPHYVPVLAGLAALDRTAGLPSARERYAKLVELDPTDLEARRAYGELLSEAGKLDQAQAELEKVLEAAPLDLRARRALALVLAARRAGSELVAELEQIVKLDPEDLEARMDLAAAYTSVARGIDAEAVYEDVLRRRPRHAAALKLAGDLARSRGDLKRAAVHYGKLRYVAPTDPRPVFLLGAAQYEAGNLAEAERMFIQGANYPGMMGDAYSNLGAIALRRGRPKEALYFLRVATKRRPGRANVRYNHAVALHALNRHADALNELRVAEHLDPNDAPVRFLAGVVSLRLGLLQDAERSFREALRLDPQNADARHNLALLEPLMRPKREDSSFTLTETVPPPPPRPAPAAKPPRK